MRNNLADMLEAKRWAWSQTKGKYPRLDTFASHVRETVNEPTGQFRGFVQIHDPKELELPSEMIRSYLKVGRTWKSLRQLRRAKRVI